MLGISLVVNASGVTVTSCVQTSNAQAFVQGLYNQQVGQYYAEDHAGYINVYQAGSWFYYDALPQDPHSTAFYFNRVSFTQSQQSLGYQDNVAGPYYLHSQVYDAATGYTLTATDSGNAAYPICPYQSPTRP